MGCGKGGFPRVQFLVDLLPGGEREGTVEETRKRLATIEQRDITAGGAAGFATSGVPSFLTEHFLEAARAQAVIASALPSHPLPESGLTVTVPRLSTGTSVAVQANEADAQARPTRRRARRPQPSRTSPAWST